MKLCESGKSGKVCEIVSMSTGKCLGGESVKERFGVLVCFSFM